MTITGTILQTLQVHWGAIAGTSMGGMLFNAIVGAMPAKDTKIASFKDVVRVSYAFVFDTIHNFASIRSGHVPEPVIPNPILPSEVTATK
jgi:poly(3-hydroxyalkanoate) synthetase